MCRITDPLGSIDWLKEWLMCELDYKEQLKMGLWYIRRKIDPLVHELKLSISHRFRIHDETNVI